nr:MAG TPA_asm: hypothetical protein [Caudoviricetes sp.]
MFIDFKRYSYILIGILQSLNVKKIYIRIFQNILIYI